jgi:hypothetical protein
MKNQLFALLLAPLALLAQETQQTTTNQTFDQRRHEVKIGAIKLLSGPIAEVTYEYVQNDDFTFGASLLKNLNESEVYFYDFAFTPFARFYFQESKQYGAKGFFVEGFGSFLSGRENVYYEFEPDRKYNSTNLGLSVGNKWVNRTGFVFEALLGLGRKISGTENAPDAIFRGDLSVGYRF